MKILKNSAIFFFDILDFYHQRKILNFIKKKEKKINTFIDIGSHKGKYFDLFAKSYLIKKVFLIEPQKEYFYYLKDIQKLDVVAVLSKLDVPINSPITEAETLESNCKLSSKN